MSIVDDSANEIIRKSTIVDSPIIYKIRTSNTPDSSSGTTTPIRATATTTWTAYPTIAGNSIQDFEIELDIDNSNTRRLWVSLSSGATDYTVLAPGSSFSFQPKNITQIFIRTASSTATFSLWVNR